MEVNELRGRDSVKYEKYASVVGKHKEDVGVNGKITLERHSRNRLYVSEVDCFGLRQGNRRASMVFSLWDPH
jgi:hypothetical protein